MDLFYRGYDANARIRSGAQHLSAAAARLAVSMVRSIPLLPESAWQAFQRLLSPDALWSLCLVLAGWLIATLIGGPIAVAVDAILVLYGLAALWEEAKATWSALKQWATAAYEARTDADLDAAAQHFATALGSGGITILEVVVTHRVFRAVEGKLRERFPTPDWLRKQYREQAEKRESTTRQKVRKTAEAVASGARYEGARSVASAFPTAAVAVGGVALGAGLLAALAWAMRHEPQKVRP